MRINHVRNVCKLLGTLVKYIPLNSDQLKRRCTTASKTSGTTVKLSNTPHPPKDPPDNYHPKILEHKAFDLPEGVPAAIFRPFKSPDEKLGPDAAKCNTYKNPEYYAYHRYSYVGLQSVIMELRDKRHESAGMRLLYEYTGSDSDSDSSSSSSDSNSSSSSSSSDGWDSKVICTDSEPCPNKPR